MNTLKTMTAAAALMLAAGAAEAWDRCPEGSAYDACRATPREGVCEANPAWNQQQCDNWKKLGGLDNPRCVQETYRDMILKGTSDIDVMERCHAVTPSQIRHALADVMQMRQRGASFGPTPFKDAHCRPTYSGFACEYNGVALETSKR
jgi:hypothetical protein